MVERRTLQQGYSDNVSNAVPAFQQMRAMEQQNPLIGRQVALRGLINRPVQGGQQYAQLQQQAKPITEFAGYQARQGGNAQQVLSDFGKGNVSPYADALKNYGNWKDAETKRANASGMLSSGFGAMIPGLAMLAIPGAGLAKIATGAAMGGITGGPVGALAGGLGSAVSPSLRLPGASQALSAPLRAASNVARQFANPMTAARQVAGAGIGRLGGRNA